MAFEWSKIKFFSIWFSAAVFFVGLAIFFANGRYFRIIDINGKKFIAELALDSESQAKGLSGRKKICRNCAMLFSFKEKSGHSFWMKDMNFDLDIIWIADNKIVRIKKNFSHDSAEIAVPDFESDNVLEINSGLAEKYGFKTGDGVKIY